MGRAMDLRCKNKQAPHLQHMDDACEETKGGGDEKELGVPGVTLNNVAGMITP
jgi:hypothetical protein